MRINVLLSRRCATDSEPSPIPISLIRYLARALCTRMTTPALTLLFTKGGRDVSGPAHYAAVAAPVQRRRSDTRIKQSGRKLSGQREISYASIYI
jgi:hypothetical protein